MLYNVKVKVFWRFGAIKIKNIIIMKFITINLLN